MRTYSSVRSQVRKRARAVALRRARCGWCTRAAHHRLRARRPCRTARARMPCSKTGCVADPDASRAPDRTPRRSIRPRPAGVPSSGRPLDHAVLHSGLWAMDLATCRASATVRAPVISSVTTCVTPSPSSTIWCASEPQTSRQRRRRTPAESRPSARRRLLRWRAAARCRWSRCRRRSRWS